MVKISHEVEEKPVPAGEETKRPRIRSPQEDEFPPQSRIPLEEMSSRQIGEILRKLPKYLIKRGYKLSKLTDVSDW